MNKSFVVASLLSAVLVFGGSLLAPVEVRFVESITKNSSISGLVFGTSSVFLIFLSYLVAKLSNKYGRKKTLLLGSLFGFVYALLYASVFNTLGIIGVKFAWAFAVAATNPVLAAYVQSSLVGNKKQGRYFGYYYSIASIAGSVGALIGGFVFEKFSFQEVVYILAVTYVVAGLVTFLLPKSENGNNDKKDQNESKSHSVFSLLRIIFKKPELRFYFASNISTSMNWGVKPFLWPLVIFAISGSDVVTGSIFATMGVVAFVLLPFAGAFADRVGAYKVITIELVLFCITGAVMVLTDNITLFWIAAAVYTVGEILNVGQAMILTEELDEDIRSEAVALDAAFDQILGFSSPLIAGILVSSFSTNIALAAFMSLYLFSLVATSFIAQQNKLFNKRSHLVKSE